jgi:hypothetical protein
VVFRDHNKAYPTWELEQRQGLGAGDHGLRPSLERIWQALRVGEEF